MRAHLFLIIFHLRLSKYAEIFFFFSADIACMRWLCAFHLLAFSRPVCLSYRRKWIFFSLQMSLLFFYIWTLIQRRTKEIHAMCISITIRVETSCTNRPSSSPPRTPSHLWCCCYKYSTIINCDNIFFRPIT